MSGPVEPAIVATVVRTSFGETSVLDPAIRAPRPRRIAERIGGERSQATESRRMK